METEFYTPDDLRTILHNYTTGYKDTNDSLFVQGNQLIKEYEKLGVLSKHSDEPNAKPIHITCSVPDCGQIFQCTADYESHYNNTHRYSCSQCKKNLPNAHLLDLHISEVHDSYFAVQAEKKPMYSCFLEECSLKFMTNVERKDHCIKEHKFPPNFRFDNPVKHKTAVKKSPENKKAPSNADSMETDAIAEEMERVSLADGPKKIKHISFGHGKVKSFQSTVVKSTTESQPSGSAAKGKSKGKKKKEAATAEVIEIEMADD